MRNEPIKDDSNSKCVRKAPDKDYHGTEKVKEWTSEHTLASKSWLDSKVFTSRSHGFFGAGKILPGKSTVMVTKCKHACALPGGPYDESETCGYRWIHAGVTLGWTTKST